MECQSLPVIFSKFSIRTQPLPFPNFERTDTVRPGRPGHGSGIIQAGMRSASLQPLLKPKTRVIPVGKLFRRPLWGSLCRYNTKIGTNHAASTVFSYRVKVVTCSARVKKTRVGHGLSDNRTRRASTCQPRPARPGLTSPGDGATRSPHSGDPGAFQTVQQSYGFIFQARIGRLKCRMVELSLNQYL